MKEYEKQLIIRFLGCLRHIQNCEKCMNDLVALLNKSERHMDIVLT